MSSGRKIFRFLKWIEDIKTIYYYILYKDTSIGNICKGLMSLSSFFYHIFDNFVWSNNVGIMGEYLVGEIKHKNAKNFFSLLRNLIKIVMDFYKFKSLYYINRQNEEEVSEAFEKSVENYKTEIYHKILTHAVRVRVKLRKKILDIVHSFLRINMLIYSLRAEPFYSNLHPIFIGFCGMTHSVISLYKVFEGIGKNIQPEKRRSTLHNLVVENENNNYKKMILDEDFFDEYYLDFNKDYSLDPSKILYKQKVSLLDDIF
jgi:hypothetical protein